MLLYSYWPHLYLHDGDEVLIKLFKYWWNGHRSYYCWPLYLKNIRNLEGCEISLQLKYYLLVEWDTHMSGFRKAERSKVTMRSWLINMQILITHVRLFHDLDVFRMGVHMQSHPSRDSYYRDSHKLYILSTRIFIIVMAVLVSPLSTSPVNTRDANLFITVPTDVLAPNGTRPSTGKVPAES